MNATEHFDRIDKYVRRDGITEAMESITALRATFATEQHVRETAEREAHAHAERTTELYIERDQLRATIAEMEQGVEELRQDYKLTLDIAFGQIAALTTERELRDTIEGGYKLYLKSAISGVERDAERISVLENALLHYAERTNWNCRRCGGSDDLNCAMLFWKGPIGMDGDPAYGHGWSIARAALSSTTQSEPAATHVKVTTNPSDPFATRDLETGGYYKWVEPEQKPGSPLHPQNSVESERES